MREQVIILNGSPRKKGYSKQLAEYMGKRLEAENVTYKIYNIYDMDIDYCNNCGYCSKVKGCRIKDDMEELYEHFEESISTILISPVAFDGPIAKVKTLIDRTNAIFHSKYTLNDSMIDRKKKRVGFLIQVGGSEHYDSQFKGGNIINEFFFKSVNSKLKYNIEICNTDRISPGDIINNIRCTVNDYINSLKDIL